MPAVDQLSAETLILVDEHATEAERNYAQWIHLAALIGGIIAAFSGNIGLPLVLAAVLIMWLLKKDQSPFIDDHGREAANFQISLIIYSLLAWITCIGIPLLIPIAILAIVGTVRASQSAQRGEYFRYPACIRFLH